MNASCKNRSFSRTYEIIVLVIGLALMVGFPLWSQVEERPEFASDLLDLLVDGGWTPEQLRELAAQDVDWKQAEGADPEVVAMALQFARNEDEEMEPMEEALLAIELALAATEMEAVGIGKLTIAITALEGVRDILTDIQAFRSGDLMGKELGETIRTRMRERVRVAARVHARDRMHERDREARGRLTRELMHDIPSSSGYWPGGRP